MNVSIIILINYRKAQLYLVTKIEDSLEFQLTYR